jgi:hypothetical protein
MRDRVAGLEFTTDVLGEATRRHRRRTAVHRTAYAAGVFGLAGAVAAAVAIGATGSPTSNTNRPASATTASARVQLAAAVKASDNISYQVRVTAGTKDKPDSWGTAQGGFDPATATGYLNSSEPGNPATYYQRLISGVLFLGSTGSPVWKQEPSNGKLQYVDALGGAVGSSADPNQLFEALRDIKATITQTSANTYHFESSTRADTKNPTVSETLAGDVTLNADKRIAKVAYEVTDKATKNGLVSTSTHEVTLELSGYGTPVKVERPTNVIVAH